jgi:hypothetical protein
MIAAMFGTALAVSLEFRKANLVRWPMTSMIVAANSFLQAYLEHQFKLEKKKKKFPRK